MFHKITPRVPGAERVWNTPAGTVQIGPPLTSGNQTGGGTYPGIRGGLNSPVTLMVQAAQNWQGNGRPIGLVVIGFAGQRAVEIIGPNIAGKSNGLLIDAGTNASDFPLQVADATHFKNYLVVAGDGSGTLGYNGSGSTLSWNAAGDVVINVPASGVACTINGLNGTDTVQMAATGAAGFLRFGWNTAVQANAWNLLTQTDPFAIGTTGAAGFEIFTNAAGRVAVGSDGHVTINAPASGVLPLLVNMSGASAGDCQHWTDGANTVGLGLANAALWQFGTVTNTALQIYTNNSTRLLIAAGGAITVQSPTSGVPVTINALAGQISLIVNAGGGGTDAAELVAPSGGTDGRCTLQFQATKTSTQQYTIGIDTSGGTTKAFEIRDITSSGTPVRFRIVQNIATVANILGWGPNQAALVDMTPDFGSATVTLTGVTTTVTGTAFWVRMGNIAAAIFPAMTGTSNSTACTVTGLPSAVAPIHTQVLPLPPAALENNTVISTSANNICAAFATGSSSTLTLEWGSALGFTASGTKGINQSFILVWHLQ